MDGYSVIKQLDEAFHKERCSHKNSNDDLPLVSNESQEDAGMTVGMCFALALIIFAAALITSLIFPNKASGAEIPEHIAVNCILGEARGEGYGGMLAVAEAMRNRGHIKGIDGCAYQPKEIDPIQQAFKAWHEAKLSNITNGADHWHADWMTPWWAKYGKITAKIGAHIFYKEVYR